MKLVCYPLLSTCSKRAILKSKKRWGHPKRYAPRKALIERLAHELNMSHSAVIAQLNREREWLLKHKRYFI